MIKKIFPAVSLKSSPNLSADKSISHRAALFAALYEGKSTIKNFSSAEDPQTTLNCLRQLGVSVQQTPLAFSSSRVVGTEENDLSANRRGDITVIIEGAGRDGFKIPGASIDCGNSGTTIRLLGGIMGGGGIKCTLTGDDSLSSRTMKRIIDPLGKMGIEIRARDDDFAPLRIQRSGPLNAIEYQLPVASAQLKSCILLAALFGDDTTTVIETVPSRDHTERLLQLPVEVTEGKKIISSDKSCKIPAQNYRIPGDFSAAAFWLTAASIFPEAFVELQAVGVNPTRTGALQILQEMGAAITLKKERMEGFEPTADIHVESSTLKPVEIGPDIIPNCIDELPALMIAMLFASGKSIIRGAGELRHKETDRLAAMVEVLEIAGANFEEREDGLIIHGDPAFIPDSGTFNSYGDHRIAMAAAVLALLAENPSKITDAECVQISYPGFWDDLNLLTS